MVFEIIASVDGPEKAALLHSAGYLTAFRINASHMPLPAILEVLEAMQKLPGPTAPCYIDLQGSKLRLSSNQPQYEVHAGSVVRIVPEDCGPSSSTVEPRIVVPQHVWDLLVQHRPSQVAIDDAKILLRDLTPLGTSSISATVHRAGLLRPRKGINLHPHPRASVPLQLKDANIVRSTLRYSFVRYALSMVSSVEEVRALSSEAVGRKIAAKVELPLERDILERIAAIPNVELWFCRGDLGAQLGLPGLACYYRRFCDALRESPALRKGRCILAGEVMDHMVSSVEPTRSEVCHLADAQCQGFSGIVLSNETVYGCDPVGVTRFVREISDAVATSKL
eukprot:NODE_2910_length_1091_cov_30.196737_g2670_i0.p1 GENE.NODE_2910_length_1091_cov_30.196737_g2670_i0~~NODE_2910_length_1091_cov_30.196737_g2670_i0.p1  ORF type:complete len:337 (-),score=53.97 NODE_2910_length_1091_cov_30.196737_g2670_i0:20-1030(-)